MITAVATGGDGGQVIVLGLSHENVKRLMDGQPISVSAVTHPGFPAGLSIMIFVGETERSMTEKMKDLFSDKTKFVAVPRDPSGQVS